MGRAILDGADLELRAHRIDRDLAGTRQRKVELTLGAEDQPFEKALQRGVAAEVQVVDKEDGSGGQHGQALEHAINRSAGITKCDLQHLSSGVLPPAVTGQPEHAAQPAEQGRQVGVPVIEREPNAVPPVGRQFPIKTAEEDGLAVARRRRHGHQPRERVGAHQLHQGPGRNGLEGKARGSRLKHAARARIPQLQNAHRRHQFFSKPNLLVGPPCGASWSNAHIVH